MFKSIIRLINSAKQNSKEKKLSENTKNNSVNEDTEKLRAISHIFIHGHWF